MAKGDIWDFLGHVLGISQYGESQDIYAQAQKQYEQAQQMYGTAANQWGNYGNAGASNWNLYANNIIPQMNQYRLDTGLPGQTTGNLYNIPYSSTGQGQGNALTPRQSQAAQALNRPQYQPIPGTGSPTAGQTGTTGSGGANTTGNYGGQFAPGAALPQGTPINPLQSLAAGRPVAANTPTVNNPYNRARPQALGQPDLTGQGQTGTQAGEEAYNPYGLTPGGQTQLNEQVGNITTAMNSAIEKYHQREKQAGQEPDPVAEAMIRETFGSQAQALRGKFAEDARATRQKADEFLMNLYYGAGQSGLNAYGQGAQGTQNVAGGVANLGLNYQQEAEARRAEGWNNLFGTLNFLGTVIPGMPKIFPGLFKSPSGGGGGGGSMGATGGFQASTPDAINAILRGNKQI